MVSTYTFNKNLEKPGNGDYVDTWNVPVNSDMNAIDAAFGNTTSLNATAGSAVLTSTQYTSLFIGVSGAMSANVTYQIPSTVGGQWIVYNTTTDATGGPWTITFASNGGGRSVIVPRLSRIIVVSDGTNIDILGYVTLNSKGTGSISSTGNISSDSAISAGTSITAGTSISATTTLSAGSSITSGASISDVIGDVRNVPANVQGSSYTLVATDNGKFIDITTGGVIVPSGVFSAGQSVTIYNDSSSSQTITQGTSVTMYQVGTSNTGNRTLSQRGLCTVFCVGTNTFVITGGGLF